MKRVVAILLMLLCLNGCGQTSSQPAVSPAFPEVNPGEGGELTVDLTVEGAERKNTFAKVKRNFSSHRTEGAEFVFKLCPDDSVPANTDLSGVEVWVYDMIALMATSSDIQQYESSDVRRYVTDASGEVRFLRGNNPIDLELQVNTLPAGIGSRERFGFYDPEENRVEYTLSMPQSVQLSVGNQLEDIQIDLYNAAQESILAAFCYIPTWTRRASSPNQVEISCMVRCGDWEQSVFHTVDLSGEDEYYKLKELGRIQLVTQQEQELLNSFAPYF